MDGHELSHFLRVSELSAQRRRRLGLQFWREHPEDLRRYQWLIAAAGIEPYYPENLELWLDQETDPEIQTTASRNSSAISSWERIYRSLRDELVTSSDVRPDQVRYLRAIELRNAIVASARAKVLGDTRDPVKLLDDFVDFAEDYDDAYGEPDRSSFNAVVRTLWETITEDRERVFVWDVERFVRFLDRVAATENAFLSLPRGKSPDSVVTTLKKTILRDGTLPQFMLEHHDHPNASTDVELERWNRLPERPFGPMSSSYEGIVVFRHVIEVYARKTREYGRVLAERHGKPHPTILAFWLDDTLSTPPDYAVDFVAGINHRARRDPGPLPLDSVAVADWTNQFEDIVGYVRSRPETANLAWLHRNIVAHRLLVMAPATWQSGQDNSHAIEALDEIELFYTKFGSADDAVKWANKVVLNPNTIGINEEVARDFAGRLASFDHARLSEPLQTLENWKMLSSRPFEFRAITISGEEFDIKQTRGRIVLVDHWTTKCASCIASMPKIKAIEERYADRGFAVVSIVYDGVQNRRRVERISRELDLTWPTLVADDQWEWISETYGFTSVPQYMLLNRDGTLYAGTAEVDMGRNLDALLDEMLAAEAEQKEVATVH